MIYDDSVLTDKEVLGVLQAIDEQGHSVRWMFRDDSNGIKFIYYCNWLDELKTDYSPLVMTIFDKFCERNGIIPEKIYMTRFTLLVQDLEDKVCLPELAYPNAEKVFIYFASNSDRPIRIGEQSVMPKMGHCLSFDYSEGYSFSPPLNDNFFIMIEIEYK